MRQGFDYLLSEHLSDVVSLHKRDGRVFRDIKARVATSVVLILDDSLPIEVGDRIVRPLRNGLKDEFVVDDPRYTSEIGGFPNHFQAKVHRLSTSDQLNELPVLSDIEKAARRESAGVESLPDGQQKERRRAILKRYKLENGLQTEDDLARHLGMSITAIQGIVRGDTKRYGPDKLLMFLTKIGVSPKDW